MKIGMYLRHSNACAFLHDAVPPSCCDCGMLRAEGSLEDLRTALDELTSAVDDGLRRYTAGDPAAIASSMISATLRQAKDALRKSQ